MKPFSAQVIAGLLSLLILGQSAAISAAIRPPEHSAPTAIFYRNALSARDTFFQRSSLNWPQSSWMARLTGAVVLGRWPLRAASHWLKIPTSPAAILETSLLLSYV